MGQSRGGVLRQHVVSPSKPSSLEGHGAGPSHRVYLGIYYPPVSLRNKNSGVENRSELPIMRCASPSPPPQYSILPEEPWPSQAQEAPWETTILSHTHEGLALPSLAFLWRRGFGSGPAQVLLRNEPGLPAFLHICFRASVQYSCFPTVRFTL